MASFCCRAARRERERWVTPPATAPAAAPVPASPRTAPIMAPAAAPRAREPVPATCGLAVAGGGGGREGSKPVCWVACAAHAVWSLVVCARPEAGNRLRQRAVGDLRNALMAVPRLRAGEPDQRP